MTLKRIEINSQCDPGLDGQIESLWFYIQSIFQQSTVLYFAYTVDGQTDSYLAIPYIRSESIGYKIMTIEVLFSETVKQFNIYILFEDDF